MLAKTKLNSIEGLISEALIDLSISIFRFDLKNNVFKKIWLYERRNKKLKDLNSLFIKQCYRIVWSVEKLQKLKT